MKKPTWKEVDEEVALWNAGYNVGKEEAREIINCLIDEKCQLMRDNNRLIELIKSLQKKKR